MPWSGVKAKVLEDIFPFWSNALISEAIGRSEFEIEDQAKLLQLRKANSLHSNNSLYFWTAWPIYVQLVLLPCFPPSEWPEVNNFVLRPGFKPFLRRGPPVKLALTATGAPLEKYVGPPGVLCVRL